MLRADKKETIKRAVGREKLDKETNTELVEIMWEQFQDLDCYETNVINTTDLSVEKIVSIIKEKIDKKTQLLI